MEKRTKVVPYRVEKECPECKQGVMEPTGQCYMTHPVQYPHECTQCDFKETYRKRYPYIDHEREDVLMHPMTM